jgi:TRAP-type uncharacterized transport system substrate-binding protein
METPQEIARRALSPRGKGFIRFSLFAAAALAVVAIASLFGIARDYAYLHATLLTGTPMGNYYALGKKLAERARLGHGTLDVVATAGSVENIQRLADNAKRCSTMFGFIQAGTPVPSSAQLDVLGRLPEPESLLLFGKRGRAFPTFAELRGASIGIGPEGSGTAYLMRQLFEDADLKNLDIHLATGEFAEQAGRVAQGRLDLAAVVMAEDAELLQDAVHKYDLDIASPRELEGLIKRHPWLDIGHIPAGRYDLERPSPSADRLVARVDTLVVTDACAPRAERVALLTLLSAQLPGFLRSNPPKSADTITGLSLAPEARQFFVSGEPEIADRYFPWLVNLMSPVYWVYLVMAVTILFNAMRGFSRFRLWRIDAAREKLKVQIDAMIDPSAGLTQAAPTKEKAAASNVGATLERVATQLVELRTRCQRHTGSMVTPMGDEMFYRYQESLINELLRRVTEARGGITLSR